MLELSFCSFDSLHELYRVYTTPNCQFGPDNCFRFLAWSYHNGCADPSAKAEAIKERSGGVITPIH
jgi:hypothetical protein